MKCCFLLFAFLAVFAVLAESAVTKKPISRTSRIRRPVSKTVSKPVNITKAKSPPSPAVVAKKPLSTVSKIAVPASSLRAASTPEEPAASAAANDPVARLAADMDRLEKIPDPTEWRDDEFNDLAMLPSASMSSNNVIPGPDDPFADYEDLLFDDYDLSDTRTQPFGGKYLQSEV